jgi:hypothetical protein
MVPMLPATVTATAVALYVTATPSTPSEWRPALLTAQPGASPGPALELDPQASQVTEHRQQPRQVTLGLAAQVPLSPAVRTVHSTVVGGDVEVANRLYTNKMGC